jgi:hypothetical protein
LVFAGAALRNFAASFILKRGEQRKEGRKVVKEGRKEGIYKVSTEGTYCRPPMIKAANA